MLEAKAVEVKQIYASAKTLSKLYDVSRDYIYTLIEEMRSKSRYNDSIYINSRVLRVRLADFDEFFRRKSLRRIK